MPDQLLHLPLLAAGSLVIAALCGYSLLGLAATRRWILPRLDVTGEDSEFSGAMVQAIMVFYGLAVALVAVNVWETYSEVSGVVSLEASRIAALHRDVSGYPEPLRSELLGEIHGYTDYVITTAWPLQRDGVHPTGGIQWMDRIQKSLFSFEPATTGSQAMHAEALRAYNQLIEARRLRMDGMLVKLPNVLWFMISAGALISLSSTFLFKVRDRRLHATLVLLLSTFIGLVITLVLAFDRPFRGDLGIGPEPYELVRDQLMNR